MGLVAKLESGQEPAAGIVVAEHRAGAAPGRRVGDAGRAPAAGLARQLERPAATIAERISDEAHLRPAERAERSDLLYGLAAAETTRRQHRIERPANGAAGGGRDQHAFVHGD